jgi:O-antigen/teichoic acid export membrane protein
VELSVSVISLVVTIYLAWKGFGVWALVAQQLIVSVLSTFIYWATGRWMPALAFSKQSFKELFGFGGFILLSNLINTLCNNIQGLLIGRFYNPATMGYYSKAKSTEELSSTFISNIIDQVSYPVLSEAQNDKTLMVTMLKKFIGVLAYVTFPLMLLLVILAKPLFVILYSERWLPSVPYFQILCFAGLAICLQGINYYAVAAVGKSKDLFLWTIGKRSIGLLFIICGLVFWGIKGLLCGMVLGSYSIYLINAGLVSKHVGYTIKQQFADLFPIIILSVISAAAGVVLALVLNCNMYLTGFLQLLVFLGLYFAGSILFKIKAFEATKEVFGILLNKTIRKR